MKIAYIFPVFPAPRETFAAREIKAICSLGHEICVFSIRPKNIACDRLADEFGVSNVARDYFRAIDILSFVILTLIHPKIVVSIFKLLLRNIGSAPNFLYTLMIVPRAIVIAKKIAKSRMDVAHVFWGHYPSIVLWFLDRHFNYTGTKSIFLGAYDLTSPIAALPLTAKCANLIFTHCKVNKPAIRAAIESDRSIEVVYRGIDLSSMRAALETSTKRTTTLISVGALIPEKGMQEVIETWQKIAVVGLNPNLRIIGNGPILNELQELARRVDIEGERIQFLKHQPPKIVFQEIRQSNFMLLMSNGEWERLPNVLKEAMYLGAICITKPTPGIDELIIDGKTGFLVKTSTEAANLVIELLADENRASKIRSAAFQHVSDQFDVSKNVRAYVQAWESASRIPASAFST